jgi:hypothetical protein
LGRVKIPAATATTTAAAGLGHDTIGRHAQQGADACCN